MAQIDIVVGTVYGAAMLVAETLADQLAERGHQVAVHDEAQLTDIHPDRMLLLISATTGQGDIPPNLQPFATALHDQAPPLQGLRYALIALGDSSYTHFCGAGRQLDDQLQALGASALLPRLEIDATVHDEPEVTARGWLSGWLAQLD